MFLFGRCRAVLKAENAVLKAENFQLSKLHDSDQTKIKISNQSKKRKFSECIVFFLNVLIMCLQNPESVFCGNQSLNAIPFHILSSVA